MKKKLSKEWMLVLLFVILFIILSILSPTRFLSVHNLQSMTFQLPEFGIFAIAMMVVIVTGGINLSLVSTAALSGIASALVLSKLYAAGCNVILAIFLMLLCAVAVSIVCGLLNGYVVAYIGAAAMMATLGTSTLFEGISLNITKGNAVSGFPAEFYWFGNGTVLGIPVPFLIFAVVAVVSIILLERTPWGQSTYMVGCNQKASKFSGINVEKVMLKVYVYSAILGSIAVIIMMSRYNSAKADYGSSYLMQSISASVLGGTNIEGGYGKVVGVITAVAILQIISSGLNIIGVNRSIIDVITGCILIIVLAMNFLSTRMSLRIPSLKKSRIQ